MSGAKVVRICLNDNIIEKNIFLLLIQVNYS